MAYVTQTDFENAFRAGELIDLADEDGDGVADADVVSRAIIGAGELIDSYLQSRFAVPLATTPGLIHKCALFIMRYDLSQDHATDRVEADYKQALDWLGQIRDGKMDIGLTPAGEAPDAPSSGGVQVSGGRSAFSRDDLDAWSGTSDG